MTQEKLAEAVDMSPTHLSNIERGNGKVSLAALVNIANVLGVTMDDLLCDNIVKCKPEFEKDIQKLLDDCDEYEIRIVKDMIASLISALRKDAKLRKNTD